MARAQKRNQFAPLERDIQAAVVEHWRMLGQPDTLVGAIPNAGALGQPGLTCGLADLLVIGIDIPGGCRVGFIELKRDRARGPRHSQIDFASVCARNGVLCATTYGRDEPIALLERWGVVRKQAAAA